MALFRAAGRSLNAKWAWDDEAEAFWQARADEAREWLRVALGEYDEPQLSFEVAA